MYFILLAKDGSFGPLSDHLLTFNVKVKQSKQQSLYRPSLLAMGWMIQDLITNRHRRFFSSPDNADWF